MRILFCTDGSEISMNALHNASHYTKEAVIDPLCVIDWSFLPTSVNMEDDNYSKAYENIADSVLNFAENAIQEKGLIMGEKLKSFGSAVEGILEQIEKEEHKPKKFFSQSTVPSRLTTRSSMPPLCWT